MQTKNPIFDDLAQIMTGAAGAVASAGEEVRGLARSRMDRLLVEMDLVSREEFELVKEMAAQALSENKALRAELKALKTAKPRKSSGVK